MAWSIALAVVKDFYARTTRKTAEPLVRVGMLAGVGWHYCDRVAITGGGYVVALGTFGGFYPGRFSLIVFLWLVLVLFCAKWTPIPRKARPLLVLVALLFFAGMLLAVPGNKRIVYPFLSMPYGMSWVHMDS